MKQVASALAIVAVSHAATAEPLRARVGYRAGNGLGWLGLCAAVDVSPRAALGLEGGPVLDDAADGAQVSLVGQLRLRASGSTPYLSFGHTRRWVHVGDVPLVNGGWLANAGYQRALGRRLELQLAIGLRVMGEAVGRDSAPVTRVSQPGYVAPNLELGLRYQVW